MLQDVLPQGDFREWFGISKFTIFADGSYQGNYKLHVVPISTQRSIITRKRVKMGAFFSAHKNKTTDDHYGMIKLRI